MGSKDRISLHPPYVRGSPPSGPGLLHSEPLTMHHPPVRHAPYDMLPHSEVMERRLADQQLQMQRLDYGNRRLSDQHTEMQRLDYENQRLAASHGTLRQELIAAQRELQVLQSQIGTAEAKREQQIRGVVDEIARMEAELQAAEPLKHELQRAQGEAQSLVVSREELVSNAQKLSQELQRTFADVQQIPALMSEFEGLRQEYQHCRATFECEKKLYNDHLKSLQEMENNYASMSKEVEKLRAELTNTVNVNQRSSGSYGGSSTTMDNEAYGLSKRQNAHEDGYVVSQGYGTLLTASVGGTTATTTGAQPGPASANNGFNAPSWSNYDSSAGPAYDPQRSVAYDAQRVTGVDSVTQSGYDSQREANLNAQYDPHRGTGYGMQGGPGYDMQRRPAYNASGAIGYEPQSIAAGGPHGHALPVETMLPYGSTTPPAHNSGGYENLHQAVNR
ncbi:hypothetical protein AAHE18_20G226400 [Arachis hypogaea]